MKKILALVMVLAMMLVCASAVAEVTFSYGEYGYDETLIADIPGSWYALGDLGPQLYIPDVYLPTEVTEELAANGIIANFMNEEMTTMFTVGYGQALNVEGNVAESVEDLAAMYLSTGATNVDIIIVNGWPVVTYMMAEQDMLGYSVFFGDGTQCVTSFYPASDASVATLAGVMITTFQ